MAYQVGKFAGVAEQMHTLADLATLAGLRQSYLDALKYMLERLQRDPLEWGDPLYRTQREGGVVCHAWIGPIIVRYAVFESEESVLIIEIKPAFEWSIRP
jgi:hypothetical protein